MSYRHVLIAGLCLCYSFKSKAQEPQATQISYDITTEAAVGTGDYTAYQLVSNRHHILGTRSNTAYMRGAVNVEHSFGKDWTLSGTVDAIASVHADHRAYLQQCFANLSFKDFFVELGAREQKQVIRDEQLSIGSFAKGTNAKPLIQAHFGTDKMWTVPYTKGILEIDFDFGYGKFLDSDYREKKYLEAPIMSDGKNINERYATNILYHQKHFYFRINFSEQFFFIGGMEHVVQFGGTLHYLDINNQFVTKQKGTGLKDYLRIILPLGDKNYYQNDAHEDWIFGNHLGTMTVQLGWNINKNHTLQTYYDDIFEDGSGMRKSNGWDGTFGLQYNNKAPGIQYVRGTVLEYFQSTNQCGPLHFDAGDYPETAKEINDKVVGDDNYYNHTRYDSYTHYGMAIGNALLTSPIYNNNGITAFRDNRVKAWHLGVNGELTERLSYLMKGSYREGWGTYHMPLATKHHSFDAMVQGIYTIGPWQFSASYAFDKGNIYGNNSTFDIKIGYHGKIL